VPGFSATSSATAALCQLGLHSRGDAWQSHQHAYHYLTLCFLSFLFLLLFTLVPALVFDLASFSSFQLRIHIALTCE
jgi:hypothetical protein